MMMTFAAVINQVANATQSQKNSMTDGHMTCLYQEVPSLLTTIDHYLQKKGVTSEYCLAFECANSVPAALTLLCLLHGEYRFMLLPPTSTKGTGDALKPLPHMCNYQLMVNASAKENEYAAGGWRPDDVLEITENAYYQAESNEASPINEKLYLRTSGSMGASKIIVHSHAKLLGNAHNCVERFQLTAADRVALAVPIFHMYGLGAGFLPAVMAGASIDLQENTHLLKYLERERQFKPTAAFLTPALCDMLLQRRGGSRIYRVAVSAGARLKEEIVRAFDDRFGSLINLYGSSELGAVSAATPDDPLDVRATTIGRPMHGVTLAPESHVQTMEMDGMQTRFVEPTEEPLIGELYCQHPWGFEAYIDDYGRQISPAATWFKTGDLAKFYPHGYIRILGRADNSMNRDGYLVLLADIERTMEKVEAIAQVVVIATQAEHKRGQHMVACCVLNQGMYLDSAQIRARCFHILPRYAVPDEVVVLDVLPTLPSGKIDRQALRAKVG